MQTKWLYFSWMLCAVLTSSLIPAAKRPLMPMMPMMQSTMSAQEASAQTFRKHFNTRLLSASLSGNNDVVIQSLERGADVNTQDLNGNTPLRNATQRHHANIVQVLLAAEADPCIPGYQGQAPLQMAAFNDLKDIARALIDAIVKKYPDTKNNILNAQDENRNTALLTATKTGHLEIVQILLAAGADLRIPGYQGQAPLYSAALDGFIGVVEELLKAIEALDKKHDILNANDDQGNTALYAAAKKNRLEIVKMLLKAGADPRISGFRKRAPLQVAAFDGFTDVAEELIKTIEAKYPDTKRDILNEKDEQGDTALHYATITDHLEIVQMLLAAGADVNQQDKHGNTPLHIAARNNNKEIVELLLKHQARVEIKNNQGYTAAQMGTDQEIKKLIEGLKDFALAWTTRKLPVQYFEAKQRAAIEREEARTRPTPNESEPEEENS